MVVGCTDYLDSDYLFEERVNIENVFQSKDYTNEWLAKGYAYMNHDYLQQVNSKKNTSFNFADDMYYIDLNYVDWKGGNYTEKGLGSGNSLYIWQAAYQAIRHVSIFIHNVDSNKELTEAEITDMKGVEDISNNTINREGEAIGSYYGLKAIGIYRTQADLDRVNANGQKILQNNQEPQLGDIMYEDIDNNGNINDADRTVIGNPFPKMQYSFNLGFSYKDFDVNTFWQGIAGVYRYNWDETTISNGGNKTSRWLDRWSESNPDGSMPRLGGTINNNYSSFWLTKGDYLRLKNLEIGYTFRQREFLTKLGVQSLRLYLAGTNLLTFTSLDDYDPEKLSTDSRNDVHPNTRTYSFGVNVKF